MHAMKFPAHTQARMDAARARCKTSPASDSDSRSQQSSEKDVASRDGHERVLSGLVKGLTIGARRTILDDSTRVVIAYRSHQERTLSFAENVNLSMLGHYIPDIVRRFRTTTPEFGDTIMLPDHMVKVTERGVKYVVDNMHKEILKGSYKRKWWTKDGEDTELLTVRPRQKPVDMLHALHTLREFGMDGDAEFLVKKGNGPIAVYLEQMVKDYRREKPLKALQRFLSTLENDLVEEQDGHLLDAAWKIYDEEADSLRKNSKK